MTGFTAALGGLRAHQSWLDVIGNNLANTNTPGFKSSRALFSDLLSVTIRSATGPTGSIGGTNPMQVGLGVSLAQVDRRMGQGALNITGNTFDLALLGRGHFAVTDGANTFYTRVGAFGLDADGNMVDIRSGFKALDPSGQPFQIDLSEVIPPTATSQVGVTGNLPAVITGPLAEELTSSSTINEGTAAETTGSVQGNFNIPAGETWTMELIVNGGAPEEVSIIGTGSMTAQDIVNQINAQVDHASASADASDRIVLTSERVGLESTIKIHAGSAGKDLKAALGLVDYVQGSETIATAGTDLNDLASNLQDYQTGDVIDVAGTDADGSPVVATFTYGTDGTTIGELTSFLDAQFSLSTVAYNPVTSQITVASSTTGEADLSLALTDGNNQTGTTGWSEHAFSVTTDGTGPDTVTTSTEVFDTSGTAQVLTMEFTRQDNGTWNMEASVPIDDGTVTSGTISGIMFNEDGSILTPTAGSVTVQFGTLSSQTISIDLGTSGQLDGLTEFGNPESIIVDFQDGYAAGTLASMQVDAEGAVEGFYTNGQTEELGRFGVALFANEAGLEESGDNYMLSTANTGVQTLGSGSQNGAGEVVGGSIEGSNVDTAEEFVHLIEAQRGFQANARVITVQDELLSEVVNIV